MNPANGKVIAQVASCDAADVDLAVASARKAFDAGHWSRRAPAARKKVLLRFAELIRKHREELALTETMDMGKPISDSMKIDIPAAANCIAWYGEAVDKVYDEVAPTSHDSLALITREPAGVVGAIVPWNFPLLMATWKLGPALATGNSVVLKPSEKSPLTALRVAELAIEAGLPEGVLNVVPGFGYTAGEALAMHMDVDCVAFTGSTRVGKRMLEYSGRSNMKRVWLECGGKAPNVVMGDVADIERAATAAAFGIFFNQGEMCSAASRLVVHESVTGRDAREDRRDRQDYVAGRPARPEDPPRRHRGPGAAQHGHGLSSIPASKRARMCASAAIGARQDSGGFFVEPTVFANVDPQMKIAREEIFGPVLSAITFKDAEEAVRIANDVSYGLTAAVWSRDITTAHRIAKSLRAGTVYVNCYDADDITVPFGGFKQSGNGRDKSLHAMDKYTELKTTWVDLS